LHNRVGCWWRLGEGSVRASCVGWNSILDGRQCSLEPVETAGGTGNADGFSEGVDRLSLSTSG
jgi:hypothetical protein